MTSDNRTRQLARRRMQVHQHARQVAGLYYRKRGYVPLTLVEIIRATEPNAALLKYNHNHDPANGQFTSGYPTSAVKTLADAQQIVANANGQYLGKDKGCASLTHALAPDLPATTQWLPGTKVQGNTDIPVGTPVATFNYQGEPGTNGYGSADHPVGVTGSSHTGIYLDQNSNGMEILHQYAGYPPHIDTLPWGSWGRSGQEGGSRYYTISH